MNGRFSTWLRAGAAALALGAMAFSGSASAATKQAGDVHIIFITHGQANDVYWSVVKNGVEAGQKVMGAKVDYHAPETFDMVQMAHADALKKPIMDAKAAGIPVGVIDSGQDQVHDWGLDLWVGGGSEYDNGVHAGEIMGKAGVKHTVCVNHEVGNVSLDDRCRGFKDGLAKNGGATSDVLPASMDPTDTASRVEAYLSSHADTDAILALGPSAATPIMQRLQQMGLLGKIKMGTFDLSPEVLEAIDKGDLMFGIDSQQYLMGYLPVVFFTMKAMYGTLPTADVMTGPAFIMKGDAAKVLALSKEGIR
ncbi:MAG: substrate-binding domain-containing protein [Rhizobiales bacterium]|nr:substrate-binding domain-containing protein [Hyphomicrobiales bacterium]